MPRIATIGFPRACFGSEEKTSVPCPRPLPSGFRRQIVHSRPSASIHRRVRSWGGMAWLKEFGPSSASPRRCGLQAQGGEGRGQPMLPIGIEPPSMGVIAPQVSRKVFAIQERMADRSSSWPWRALSPSSRRPAPGRPGLHCWRSSSGKIPPWKCPDRTFP